jgi:hypothetical protein
MPGNVTLSFGCAVSSLTPVTINYYTPFYAGCFNYFTFGAASSVNVDTNLSIFVSWYGDLGGYMSTYITIVAGTSCNTTSVYSDASVNCNGENLTNTSAYTTIASSAGQTYSIGGWYFIGYSPC